MISGNINGLMLLPAIVLYLYLLHAVMNRLRDKHNEQWVAQGSPGFMNLQPHVAAKFCFYCLVRQDYKMLGDPTLSRLIYVTRALFLISVVGIVWCSVHPRPFSFSLS